MRYLPKRVDKPLGQILVEGGVITRSQLKDALETQKKEGGLIGEVIISLGFVASITCLYCDALGPLVNRSIQPELSMLINSVRLITEIIGVKSRDKSFSIF